MGLTPEAWARVRVVSWDVDGTLFEMPALVRALRGLVLRRFLGLRWGSIVRGLLALRRMRAALRAARTGPLDTAMFASPGWRELSDEWLVPAVASAGPRPGVLALLDAIDASGRSQVVLSDLPATAKLHALVLGRHFARVFVGADLGMVKPHAGLFRHVLDALGVQPEELLHVGDRNDTDGAAAHLGIAFVHVDDLRALAALATG